MLVLYKHCSYCHALQPARDLTRYDLDGVPLCALCLPERDGLSIANTKLDVARIPDWEQMTATFVCEGGYEFARGELIRRQAQNKPEGAFNRTICVSSDLLLYNRCIM